MAAEDNIGFRIHHQLHHHAFVAARQCVFHRAEGGFVDVDLVCLAGLFFGQAYCAEFGLREYSCWHQAMVDHDGLAAKHRIRKGMALTDCNRCEVYTVGHITHGID